MSRWACRSLASLGTVITGSTPKTSEEHFYGGQVPFVTPVELGSFLPINTARRSLSESGVHEARLIPEGAVLVGCIGTLGKVGIAGREIAINQQINSIEFDTETILPRFGFYACRMLKPKLEAIAPATTISIVSKSKFGLLEIPVPSLAEQRRIVNLLDQVEALRAKRREALTQLDELAQSIFVDMFGVTQGNPKGWASTTLGHVVDLYAGGTLPPGEKYRAQADGYFLLKVSDMNLPGNAVFITSCQEWSPIPGTRSATCPPGAVVIPKRGGAIGTNKKRLTTRSGILDPNLMAVWPRPESLRLPYLYQWFLQFDLVSITNGSSVPQLNKRDLDPLPIALPPVSLQETFAERTALVSHMKVVQQAHLDELDALFASLQYRAFRGEL